MLPSIIPSLSLIAPQGRTQAPVRHFEGLKAYWYLIGLKCACAPLGGFLRSVVFPFCKAGVTDGFAVWHNRPPPQHKDFSQSAQCWGVRPCIQDCQLLQADRRSPIFHGRVGIAISMSGWGCRADCHVEKVVCNLRIFQHGVPHSTLPFSPLKDQSPTHLPCFNKGEQGLLTVLFLLFAQRLC